MSDELEILSPGLLITVQDGGRYGHQAEGISPSGCMDMRSFHRANSLVNNAADDAVLEILMGGCSFAFHTRAVVAFCGARVTLTLNGQTMENDRAFAVEPGSVLSLGYAENGRYIYMAVAGGILTTPVLGSRSTHMKIQIGGLEGRKLQAGDLLPIKSTETELSARSFKRLAPLVFPKELTIAVLPGPQKDMFTDEGWKTFIQTLYHVSNDSDRMGYRLEGTPIAYDKTTDIISEGTVFGSIQVPPNGQPIVLMADRQTTGGYAKIATVVSTDLPKLAQALPGTGIRFSVITEQEARKRLKKLQWIERLEKLKIRFHKTK